jgi:hypothetical protein
MGKVISCSETVASQNVLGFWAFLNALHEQFFLSPN